MLRLPRTPEGRPPPDTQAAANPELSRGSGETGLLSKQMLPMDGRLALQGKRDLSPVFVV